MRAVYIARANMSLSTAKTAMLGTLPSGTLIEILEAKLMNTDQEAHEQMRVGLFRVTTLGSPTGTSLTAANVQKTEPGASNTGLTWTVNLTGEPTTYDANPLDIEGVPNEIGYHFEPIPEDRPWIGSGASFGLRLMDNLTNTITAECVIKYRELS